MPGNKTVSFPPVIGVPPMATKIFIPQTALVKFRESLRGQSFCPGEQGFDAVRKVPNAMIDRHPAVIARCAGAADVISCVRFAREHDVVVSVRGGGHSVAGKSVCEGGLMVDLSAMKGIRVDPLRRTVRAEAGVTLGEFDRETQAFGLATTLGCRLLLRRAQRGRAGIEALGEIWFATGGHDPSHELYTSAEHV